MVCWFIQRLVEPDMQRKSEVDGKLETTAILNVCAKSVLHVRPICMENEGIEREDEGESACFGGTVADGKSNFILWQWHRAQIQCSQPVVSQNDQSLLLPEQNREWWGW